MALSTSARATPAPACSRSCGACLRYSSMTAPNSPATPASAMTSTLVATDSLNDRM
jgi:hypothetical protein